MRKLVDGYHKFHARVFPRKQRLYRKLAVGQKPQFFIITCADSRVQPLEFTSSNPGDFFEERSIGNILPPPGEGEHEAAAAVEYALVALGVQHIIICGHSQCGAMKAILNPETLPPMPIASAWLRHASKTLERVAEKHGHLEGEELLDATVRENVLVQLDHLRQQPSVAERLADGRVEVHGWVFDIEHGRVLAHDPKVDRFVPLSEAYEYLTV